MGKAKVFMLTVGHAPRDDLMSDLEPMLSKNIEAIQCGALDEFSVEQVKTKFLARENEPSFMTRIADGTMVVLSSEKVLPLIQKRINWAQGQGAAAIVMLCTSRFPNFESSVPVISPFSLLHSVVPAIAGGMRVAAAFPFAPYGDGMAAEWGDDGIDVMWEYVAPGPQLTGSAVADVFRNKKPDLLILDCIGYNHQTRSEASEILGIPVIQPKKLIASILNCMFDM